MATFEHRRFILVVIWQVAPAMLARSRNVGSLTFDALSFPIKKGSASVSVDLSLNSLIPAALAQTVTTVTASTKGGDKIFCMEVFTAPVSSTNTSSVVVV